jgi:predicted RNA polymerase sigma factor
MGTGFAALRRSFRRAGFGSELADDAASTVVVRAYQLFRERHGVPAGEPAWMASVAFHHAVDESRAQKRSRAVRSTSLSLSPSGRFP